MNENRTDTTLALAAICSAVDNGFYSKKIKLHTSNVECAKMLLPDTKDLKPIRDSDSEYIVDKVLNPVIDYAHAMESLLGVWMEEKAKIVDKISNIIEITSDNNIDKVEFLATMLKLIVTEKSNKEITSWDR